MKKTRHTEEHIVQAYHGVSERRSCLALVVDRSSVRYVSHRPDRLPLLLRIRGSDG